MKRYISKFEESKKISKEAHNILFNVLHSRSKRGAKLTFDISNINPSEIQEICLKIKDAGFSTYISSGNLVVQK